MLSLSPPSSLSSSIIDDVIVAGRSKPCLVLEPRRNLTMFALRPSFPSALDGGGCQGQSEVIVMMIFVVNHHDNDESDVDYDLFLSTIISLMISMICCCQSP